MADDGAERLLPAICDQCGRIWVPRAIALGAGVQGVTISNVSVSPCPYCGGSGHIPDGVYESTESGVRLITRLDPRQRRAVAEVFERARLEDSDQEELARAIEKLADDQAGNAESVRELAAEVRRLNHADWKFWLLVVLTAIQAVGGVRPADITRVASDVIERVVRGLGGAAEVTSKPGRNELCPCRSGEKYKYCHGAPK